MTTSDSAQTPAPLAPGGGMAATAMDDDAAAAELKRLREDFPQHEITVVMILDRRRYAAQRRVPEARPYLAVTEDLGELRDALQAGQHPG